MKVVTFYSYKGGTGRTLAATNFAVYLAKLGLNVVILDFDLDAPGVDSKFPGFSLPQGQKGLIDYVLHFQRSGQSAGGIKEFACQIPLNSQRRPSSLHLIPAGDYLSNSYAAQLNELNWSVIFSPERDGVGFFQGFLSQIESDLSPDVVVIDSRTGFSEIGGLCTQQLADETVILSSLAAESIKMTRHLSQLIRQSPIAKSLQKEVGTKIVVSRVPKPRDIHRLKTRCCKEFRVQETNLFFLFSCSALEREEFVAMLTQDGDDELIGNYVQLFQGLDVEVAQESIRTEIEHTERGLLSISPEQSEARIRELVALYPHTEVYRSAMRFFNLTRKTDDTLQFATRLLDILPGDVEAQRQVADHVLSQRFRELQWRRRKSEGVDLRRLTDIVGRVYDRGDLTAEEKVRFADLLEDVGDKEKGFRVAFDAMKETTDEEQRMLAMTLAARMGMEVGKVEVVDEILALVPLSRLRGSLAVVAFNRMLALGQREKAFEVSKFALATLANTDLVVNALKLGAELGQAQEIIEILLQNKEFEMMSQRDPSFRWRLEAVGLGSDIIGELFDPTSRRRKRGT